MNLPLAAVVAYIYVATLFVYGVYVKLTVSLPTPVLTLLEYEVFPLTHVVEYAVISVLVRAFLFIVTVLDVHVTPVWLPSGSTLI